MLSYPEGFVSIEETYFLKSVGGSAQRGGSGVLCSRERASPKSSSSLGEVLVGLCGSSTPLG